MTPRELARLERELREYLDSMIEGMARIERRESMRNYVTGLLLDGERKSCEPMAARLVDALSEVGAMRQRLLDCVGQSKWSDATMLERLALKFERELPGVEALVVDDTGFPKKGEHSVGVARQYSGTLGRTENCQVATSLHLAGEQGSGCIGVRLYLPEEWTHDRKRCREAGVSDDVPFATKWEISLAQIDEALAWGVRKHVVLADPGYGDIVDYRDGLTTRGLDYLVGVKGGTVVWPPDSMPERRGTPDRRGKLFTRSCDDEHPPTSITELAATLEFRKVAWREGSRGWQRSRFAAVRIRTAHHHSKGSPPGEEQWLLCEWPKGEDAPCKFRFSTLPKTTSLHTLVRLAKLRWRVERDYQEMKQEVGLDHYEGRSWRGFHHHATLCAVAHGFLALRRALFPPEAHALDPADGPQSASASPAANHRLLSTLSSDLRPDRAPTGAVADLLNAIE